MKPQINLEEFIPDENSKKALFDVLTELKARKIIFLFGGMTTINCILGLIRFSQDIDLFFEQGRDKFVHEVFLKHGFKGKHRRIAEFSKLRFGQLHVDIIGSKTFPITETLLRQAKKEKAEVKFLGETFQAMPVEDTILAKLERDNARDRYDIGQVLQHYEIDMAYAKKRANAAGKSYLLDRLREF